MHEEEGERTAASATMSVDAEMLAQLARDLSKATGFPDTADEVVAFAQRCIDCEQAGITLVPEAGHGFETIGATDASVQEADRLQYELREGPCVLAAVDATAETIVSRDVATDERWPRWGPKARELGFESMLSVELRGAKHRIGALNLYGSRQREFDRDEVAIAQVFAFQAGAALAAAREQDTLRAALDTRTMIGQAQGLLMERFDLDADKAFNVLRRYSQDSNVKLRTVAQQLVDRRILPTEEGQPRVEGV